VWPSAALCPLLGLLIRIAAERHRAASFEQRPRLYSGVGQWLLRPPIEQAGDGGLGGSLPSASS
jgi:hypothetical protein